LKRSIITGILVFICFFGNSQEGRLFVTYEPIQKNEQIWEDAVETVHDLSCISEDICFFVTTNLKGWQLSLFVAERDSGQSQFVPEIVDQVSPTDYKWHLYFYRTDQEKDGILLIWETEYEFASHIMAYWLRADTLNAVGHLPVILDCMDCDYAGYPVESISIRKIDDRLLFDFSREAVLNDTLSVKPGNLQGIYSKGKLSWEVKGR